MNKHRLPPVLAYTRSLPQPRVRQAQALPHEHQSENLNALLKRPDSITLDHTLEQIRAFFNPPAD